MTIPLPLILSLLISAGLFPFFGFYVFLIPIVEVFIDLDGMIYYMLKNKELNPVKVFNSKKYKNQPVRILHSFEFLVLIIVLAFVSAKIFIPVLVAILIHYSFDIYLKSYQSKHGWFLINLLVKRA